MSLSPIFPKTHLLMFGFQGEASKPEGGGVGSVLPKVSTLSWGSKPKTHTFHTMKTASLSFQPVSSKSLHSRRGERLESGLCLEPNTWSHSANDTTLLAFLFSDQCFSSVFPELLGFPGEKKIHIFCGQRVQDPLYAVAPSWRLTAYVPVLQSSVSWRNLVNPGIPKRAWTQNSSPCRTWEAVALAFNRTFWEKTVSAKMLVYSLFQFRPHSKGK